jgi:hypothetical protein
MKNVRIVMGALAALTLAASPLSAQDKAAGVLAAAREAIGGGKLASLQTLSVQARMARNMGERQMTSELQILVETPDKYARIEEITAPIARTMNSGFSGDTAIRPAGATMGAGGSMMIVMGGPGGAPAAPKMTPGQEAEINAMLLRSQRTEISRLMLGWAAMAHPSLDATYTYAGEAESPDGKAHVIDVKAGDFAAQLFIDQATSLPLMLTYRAPEARVMTMRGPGGPGAPAQRGAPGTPPPPSGHGHPAVQAAPSQPDAMRGDPPKLVDYQMYFSDWREAGGIKFPHVLQRATGGATVEEWEITKVAVNQKIDPKKFQ